MLRFTVQSETKKTLFEIHCGREPRTKLSNLKNAVSVDSKDLSVYFTKFGGGNNGLPSNVQKKTVDSKYKREMTFQQTKKPTGSVSMNKFEYIFKFFEKNYKKGSLDSKFKNRKQTTLSGTEHTVTTSKIKNNAQKVCLQLVAHSANSYRTNKAVKHPPKRPANLLEDFGNDYRRWQPVHLYKKRDSATNEPQGKRGLVKEKRTAQKQQGPIHVTEQKHGGEGNGPEFKHCVRRRVRLLQQVRR